ncbi:MAG: CARDB domain-containing protein [Patescibacteria group bacterium]|jgi:hypothetical protein
MYKKIQYFILSAILCLSIFGVAIKLKAEVAKPDLAATDIKFTSPGGLAGEDGTIWVTVKNLGGDLTDSKGLTNTYFNLSLQGFVFNSATPSITDFQTSRALPTVANPLKTNESITFSWVGKFSIAGNKILTYTVDNANELEESNDANNSLTKTIVIGSESATAPDLAITSLKFSAPEMETGVDGTMSVTIKNLGADLTDAKGLTDFELNLAGQNFKFNKVTPDINSYQASRNLPTAANPLKTNESITFSWVGNFSTGGNLYMQFTADNKNELEESNENNNSIQSTIVITDNSESKKCTDSDNGKDVNVKGTGKGVAYWGKALNLTESFDDYCLGGNELNEITCGSDGYVHQENIKCEHGCWLGACCGPEGCKKESYCKDSDGGKIYGQAGYVSTVKYNDILKFNDKCVVVAATQDGNNFYVQSGNKYYSSADKCSGAGCYIAEAYCSGVNDKFKVVKCASCENGACTGYSEDESSGDGSELAKDNYDAQINKIKDKANLLQNDKVNEILSELKLLRDTVKEQAAKIKYLDRLVKEFKKITEKMETAINNFITYGVDANTQKLGEGERAAVIYSYKAAFDKLPETEAELTEAIKIANGRFPSVTSDAAEKKAKDQFVKIYKRVADMNDAKDAAAVKVMAYGLRQKAENRNLNSEKAGIKIFKNIFGKAPSTTENWNAMQAITYSGATQKKDSDKDLVADETEAKLGTDPKKSDTDGDGFKDGTEVLDGYNPKGSGKIIE